MISRRIIVGAVAVGAAAATIAAANPAFAAGVTTIAAGSAPSGTAVAVRGTLTAPPSGTPTTTQLNLKDFNSGISGKCLSSTLNGTTTVGSVTSPGSVATINGTVYNASSNPNGVQFGSCTTAGLPLTINGVAGNNWSITSTGNTASGVTPINISNIKVAVSSSSCTFQVSGSVTGKFTNGNPSKISTNLAASGTASSLVVSNFALVGSATSCLAGAVKGNGDKIGLDGAWLTAATNSAYNPVTANASGF